MITKNDIIIKSSPYEFDLDHNCFPVFTKKNIEFLSAIIDNDSNYGQQFDSTYEDSSAYFLDGVFPKTYDEMLKAISLIDKENSTHLSVSSMTKGEDSARGRIIMAEGLMKLQSYESNKLEERIYNGDLTLVQEISNIVPNRKNFSFASKFCTYTNRYCFKKDNFSIFDEVVCNILPYYAYVYLEEKWWRINRNGRVCSIVKDIILKENEINYELYSDLIQRIIDKANEISDVTVTRQSFDALLWYYYKSNTKRLNRAYNVLKNSGL